MLVITRRPNEKIHLPTLDVTIQLVRVTGTTARIGIEAPPNVRILREGAGPQQNPSPSSGQKKHAQANVLSKVTLGIHLARKLWLAGRPAEADAALETALVAIDQLEQTAKPQPTPGKCRTLIVDDDPNERELLAGLLGMNGCECATAADGQSAMEYLDGGGRPDVVLLDMAMPRCDGPETLRRIRADERYSGMRVFSVSSTSPAELNLPTGPGGFDGWFPKPLNPGRLWDAIQAAVKSPAAAN